MGIKFIESSDKIAVFFIFIINVSNDFIKFVFSVVSAIFFSFINGFLNFSFISTRSNFICFLVENFTGKIFTFQ